MTTQKQIEANCQNAQLSTGPMTVTGKGIVSANAIKHGIFTKDLILTSAIGQENEGEYQGIFDNLADCLSPCNQLESLLVEKIAVDFWRLRRTIKFETGSIAQCIKTLLKELYSYGNQNNEKIDEEIQYKRQLIAWNLSYLEYLTKGEVTFDQPKWERNAIESDIIEDFYMIAKTLTLTKEVREKLYEGLNFDELRVLLKKNGYSETEVISTKLIELYTKQNHRLGEEIQKLTKQKLVNEESNKLTFMLGIAPQTDNADKVLKYERSLQKSIFQNLLLLKKLQGAF